MYMRKGIVEYKCKGCGGEKFGVRNQVWCSRSCYYKFQGKVSQFPGLGTGTVGAIQELRVSIDLMIRGYEVFRALSSNASCDLLGIKNKKMIRIEVRTGYRLKGGNVITSKDHRADYLAVATQNEIIYEPKLV